MSLLGRRRNWTINGTKLARPGMKRLGGALVASVDEVDNDRRDAGFDAIVISCGG
jgi:hypothetical protein